MAEVVEGGASLAWRLLATLEGGSLFLAASALVAYTARGRVAKRRRRRTVHSVLVTNTTNPLGKEIKRQLESHGCIVSTMVGGATNGADAEVSQVDALVVVGAESRASNLDGMAGLVSEDVYGNLKILNKASPLVKAGGYMAWACAGATRGAFSGAEAAFDGALHASLIHVAKTSQCEPIWVGRVEGAERLAEQVVAALMPSTSPYHDSRFSIRNAAYKMSGYIGRWLKIIY